ncbi:hypothetical protein [Vibrio vulnificus]|uniref:hypothetical protein n=1 Tax=Vibrio vulnificus TaxID=672 RepID=UPI001592DD47|nr:hypothetical protein [Vibrio vulnificus]EJE8558594.1 hypothetical protein [Vibrio vulnificus]NVD20940.1 glycosyltransferase family 4 protein [Vibrio vulnificus]
MNCKKQIVIVGKLPPPFGGVAVSIKNHFEVLKSKDGIDVELFSPLDIFKIVTSKAKFVHFNFSKSYKRLIYTLICFAFRKKVIHTVHGQYFSVKNIFNHITGLFSHRLLVLNQELYGNLAPIYSGKVHIVSPILSVDTEFSSENKWIQDRDSGLKYILLYSNKKTEIDGKDVYGVDFVLSFLNDLNELGFKVVFLDLGKDYSFLKGSSQIDYYDSPMNFKDLLASVDIYIRPTSTDGQSIAVLESLSVGTPVLASDSVPRPEGCYLYQHENQDEFIRKLRSIDTKNNKKLHKLTSVDEYLEIIGFKDAL